MSSLNVSLLNEGSGEMNDGVKTLQPDSVLQHMIAFLQNFRIRLGITTASNKNVLVV